MLGIASVRKDGQVSDMSGVKALCSWKDKLTEALTLAARVAAIPCTRRRGEPRPSERRWIDGPPQHPSASRRYPAARGD